MAKDLLLEIGLEEMPANVVTSSQKQLEEKVRVFLEAHYLTFETIRSFATPRRLAVLVTQVSDRQKDRQVEAKGPAKKIALDADGNWTKAAAGFAKGQGLSVDALTFKAVNGVDYVYVVRDIQGKPAQEVLQGLREVITQLTFPVTMRWADYDLAFIRPIHWLVALFGEEVIPFTLLDIQTDRRSFGHRFLGDAVTITHPLTYETQLKEQYVIADALQRKEMIRAQVQTLADQHHWTVTLDEDLLEEVNHLVEYPTAFAGHFDETYLSIPKEVLIASMKEHQRYFDVQDATGALCNHFIAVRNGDHVHLENVIFGNEKVLTARLEDAAFFYKEDKKLTIDMCVEKLKQVTFHDKIGTMYEKMQRVGVIAQCIGQAIGLSEPDMQALKRAAAIYKFDLVTNMVGEFPELQGVMGEKYAQLQGEEPAVATAIREHYLPTSSEGALPQTSVGTVLAVADKLDSLVRFFAVDLIPTGSNDPYALRRQALGIIRMIANQDWSLHWGAFLADIQVEQEVSATVWQFMLGRLRQLLSAQGIRQDVIEAVATSEQDDLVAMFAAANELQAHLSEATLKPTIEALTRVLNLAKKAPTNRALIDPALFENEAENALHQAIDVLEEQSATATAAEIYQAFLALQPLIVAYFDQTMVMTEDDARRQNRLAEMHRLAQQILSFANTTQLLVK